MVVVGFPHIMCPPLVQNHEISLEIKDKDVTNLFGNGDFNNLWKMFVLDGHILKK